MSKYIIELDDRIKIVTSVGVTENGVVYTTSDYVHNLEELNSDYINEHYGELQDEAYQKGFEDGKNSIDMGCEGCRYSLRFAKDEPCKSCSNCYKSKYEPMPKEDDRIEVGDVIANNTEPGLKVWVTTINEMGFCGMAITDFGSVKKGELFDSCSTKGWHKTGHHFDIASILEAMRE